MRILLISDEPERIQTLKATLHEYYLETALTGTDGCNMATLNSYDLIILALNPPQHNGVEMCRNIRDGNE